MKILETRCEKTFAGPGSMAYNAEAKIEDNGEILFVHVCYHDGEHYTIDETSMYDYMTNKTEEEPNTDFREEYEELEEAEESKYYEIFLELEKLLEGIIVR